MSKRASWRRVEWTAEEDAYILRRTAEGASCEAISQELPGRTRNSVVGRRTRLLKRVEAGEILPTGETPADAPRREPVVARAAPVEPSRPRVLQKKVSRYTHVEGLRAALPHLLVKQGTVLHVYPRDPYAQEPLATYDREGTWWVRRGAPPVKFKTARAAVEAHQ